MIQPDESPDLKKLNMMLSFYKFKVDELAKANTELCEALNTLVLLVGMTAFKYEEQRKPLQEACDLAMQVLKKRKMCEK